jgi:mannose-6-phosphate isomerase-like protein (cupin superfamily)
MKTNKIIKELKAKYPGKKILLNPEDNPTEIIVEIEPTAEHPERSLALAVVGESKPHYHKVTTEIYEVVKGELTVTVDGKKHALKPGDKLTIKPNTVHSAQGGEAWFLTYSNPGWTFADHILAE